MTENKGTNVFHIPGFPRYKEKAAYFDANVNAPWASPDYGPEEIAKLGRLFEHTGPLAGFRVLEPGCGTGRLTHILSDLVGPSGKVVALDISPFMAEAARSKTHQCSNVEVHLAAVETFPLLAKAYDLILCHQVFPHFEDKAYALKRLVSSLKPGGKLVVFHFIPLAEINDFHRKRGTAVEKDTMPDGAEMNRLFNEAGLAIAFIRDDSLGYFLSSRVRLTTSAPSTSGWSQRLLP
jgi:SAM-dependent methyltransferase